MKWLYTIMWISIWVMVGCKTHQPSVSQEIEQCQRFVVDVFDDSYVQEEYGVSKFDSEGRRLYQFKNQSLGAVDRIDIGVGRNILLFYKKSQVLVLLDNLLNEIDRISFADLNYWDVSAVCFGPNEQVICVSYTQQKLWQLGLIGQEDVEIARLELSPTFAQQCRILYANNMFYLTSPDSWMKMSKYGEQLKSNALPSSNYAIDTDGGMYYFKDLVLYKYEPLLPNDKEILSVQVEPCNFIMRNGAAYAREGGKLINLKTDE